jgi:hypothetical protein
MLHIAIFTAVALAAPLLAGTADAKSRGERDHGAHRGGVEIVIGDRGRRDHGDRGYRRHGRHDLVSPYRIERKVRRLGGHHISTVRLDGGVYRVRATDYRGNMIKYKFDARSGSLISARPVYRGRDRGRRGGRGWHGSFGGIQIQSW